MTSTSSLARCSARPGPAAFLFVVACLTGLPAVSIAQSCDQYRQQAQEARRAAQENRANGAKIGSGPSAQPYLAAAQALENAATQYDLKYSQCSQGAGGLGGGVSPGMNGANPRAQAIGNAVGLIQQLMERNAANQANNPENVAKDALNAARLRREQQPVEPAEPTAGASDLNDRIEAALRAQESRQRDQDVQRSNPRLVDPDCSIAAWGLQTARANVDQRKVLQQLTRSNMTPIPGHSPEQSAKQMQAASDLVASAESSYQQCMASPVPQAPPAAKSGVSYIEYIGNLGQIRIDEGRVSASPPKNADPRTRDYFLARLERIKANLGLSSGNAQNQNAESSVGTESDFESAFQRVPDVPFSYKTSLQSSIFTRPEPEAPQSFMDPSAWDEVVPPPAFARFNLMRPIREMGRNAREAIGRFMDRQWQGLGSFLLGTQSVADAERQLERLEE